VADAPRHINLLLLLRLTCELLATTIVALVNAEKFGPGWRAALITAGSMIVISYVAVGVAPEGGVPVGVAAGTRVVVGVEVG